MDDRQFIKSFGGMLGALVALTLILIAIATLVTIGVNRKMDAAKQGDRDRTVAERIAPVGSIAVGNAAEVVEAVVPAANAANVDGKSVYESSCVACHASGVAGAPKLGDTGAWADRIAQGLDVLQEHAIKGYQGGAGYMPPKGGNAALGDDEVKAAVEYMVGESSE